MKALQSLPEAEDTPWIKWELIRATTDRLDNTYSGIDAVSCATTVRVEDSTTDMFFCRRLFRLLFSVQVEKRTKKG